MGKGEELRGARERVKGRERAKGVGKDEGGVERVKS